MFQEIIFLIFYQKDTTFRIHQHLEIQTHFPTWEQIGLQYFIKSSFKKINESNICHGILHKKNYNTFLGLWEILKASFTITIRNISYKNIKIKEHALSVPVLKQEWTYASSMVLLFFELSPLFPEISHIVINWYDEFSSSSFLNFSKNVISTFRRKHNWNHIQCSFFSNKSCLRKIYFTFWFLISQN